MSVLNDQYYADFEDAFRGSEADISERLKAYLPLISRLPSALKKDKLAVDLGCGRGEFLRLLREAGWKVRGVDINTVFLDRLKADELEFVHGDALDHLKSMKDGSAGIVSGFHIIEHVSHEYLLELVAEAHRVLAEDGLLIFETPNPESQTVWTTFYIDPTHIRPLPPMLTAFCVRRSGFRDVGVLRLNGMKGGGTGPLATLTSRLFQASLDYAVLGRKDTGLGPHRDVVRAWAETVSEPVPCDASELNALADRTDHMIDDLREKGIVAAIEGVRAEAAVFRDRLHTMVADADAKRTAAEEERKRLERLLHSQGEGIAAAIEAAVQPARAEAERTRTEVRRLESELGGARTQAQEAENRLAAALADDNAKAVEIENLRQHAQALEAALAAVRSSASWTFAAPVRAGGRAARLVVSPLKPVGRPLLAGGLAAVRRFPFLKPMVLGPASLLPPVKRKLIRFSQVRGGGALLETALSSTPLRAELVVPDDLPPTARAIYARIHELATTG